MSFKHFIIRVALEKDPHNILMRIEDGYDADDCTVVFAAPEKLAPLMEEYKKDGTPEYRERKRGYAVDGFYAASRGALSCGDVAGPSENPVPLPIVHCHSGLGNRQIAFTNGVTRTLLLLETGAAFIPMQAFNNEAAALNALIGNGTMPVPAARYIVDAAHRRNLILKHYEMK